MAATLRKGLESKVSVESNTFGRLSELYFQLLQCTKV